MPGELQPLVNNQRIVDTQGMPTEYFIRWAQQRQIDIAGGITAAQAQQLIDDWSAARQIIAGTALDGGGTLDADVTIDHADSAVTPDTYGDATHVPQITVDAQGHITDVTEVAISGGGGGGDWWFDPPLASSFSSLSGDANSITLSDDADVGLLFDGGTAVGGDILRMAYRTLTDKTLAWTLTVRIDSNDTADNFAETGILLYDSVTPRLITFGRNTTNIYRVAYWNTGINGSFSSGPYARTTIRDMLWFRVVHTGGNLVFYQSSDGKSWTQVFSASATAWLTARADRVGIGIKYTRGSPNWLCSVGYFDLSGPGV